jgi:signal peptidase I
MIETAAAVQAPPRPRPQLHQPGFLREVLETLVLIGAIYALVNLATVRFFIDGPSMQPNFYAGQFLVVNRMSYMLGAPDRGDVVVFNAPGNGPDDPPLIKRLIGLPGETVEIRATLVYVNGDLLDEPYIKESCSDSRCRDASWTLGPNEYFFMGDNRNNSKDSRVFGPVPRDRIVGEAFLRYWPPPDWVIVEHYRFPEPST